MPIFDLHLAEKNFVLLDGSMGTELFRRGLPSGMAPEIWNVENPGEVAAVHRAYVDAGSEVLLTNSFGGTAYRLALHDLADQVTEINRAAAALARAVVDEAVRADPGRRVLVAGSMGPTGDLLEPLGSMNEAQCQDAFAAQADGLAAGGVDLLWIETMSSLEEVEAAVAGIRSATDLPLCATLSFDTVGRTMMGVSGEQVAEILGALGLVALGANCGSNLSDSEVALAEMRGAEPDLVLIAKCNAGIPEWRDGELRYDAGPDAMAAHAHRAHGIGARLIGGCCGSTPDHIAKMRMVLDGGAPAPIVAAAATTTATEGRPERTPGERPRRRRSSSSRRSR